MSEQVGKPRTPPLGANGDLLDSWKEVASYLGRAVRTVQRWEKDEGLPIHRHGHSRQGTVYAYRKEVDVWWEGRRSVLEEGSRAKLVHFGPFEADLSTGRLRRDGAEIGLPEQPFRLLARLLDQPGHLISRADLLEGLWPGDADISEHNLNAAINRVREALGESAQKPEYLETVAGLGYRFRGPVEVVEEVPPAPAVRRPERRPRRLEKAGQDPPAPPVLPLRWKIIIGVLGFAAVIGAWQATWGSGDRWWFGASPTLVKIFESTTPLSAVSPDGQWIAFVETDTRLIKVRPRSGGTDRQIGERGEGTLAWSWDSRRLAAVVRGPAAAPPSKTHWSVRIFDLTTGQTQDWWKGPYGELPSPQDWFPSGDRLLTMTYRPDGEVALSSLSLTDGAIADFAEMPRPVLRPRVSPNGQWITYAADRDGNHDVYLRPAQGGEETRLTEDPALETGPLWAPDGESILFTSNRSGGDPNVWGIEIDARTGKPAGQPYLVSEQAGPEEWTESVTQSGELILRRNMSPPQIFLVDVNAATGAPSGEATSPFRKGTQDPFWSFDGNKLFFRFRSDAIRILEHTLASGREASVPLPPEMRSGLVTPSPDGRTIVSYQINEDNSREIREYKPASGEIRSLFKFDGWINPPITWSADQKRLLFTVTRRTEGGIMQEILLLPARGGEPVRISTTSGRPPHPKLSPGGEEVAFVDGDCIFGAPSSGLGEPRRISCASEAGMLDQPPHIGGGYIGRLSWSPHGDKLAWIVNNINAKRVEIIVVDYDTGAHLTAWAAEPEYETAAKDVRWSPKGDQIAFTVARRRRLATWALSNFLP